MVSRRWIAPAAALLCLVAPWAAAQQPQTAAGSDLDDIWESLDPSRSPVDGRANPSATAGSALDADEASAPLLQFDSAPSPSATSAPRAGEKQVIGRHGGGAGRENRAGAPTPGPGSWVKTTGALAAVLGLILLLGWGYRAVALGGPLAIAGRGKRAGLIEIVSRTTLTPKQALCLVRVGPRLVLVGVGGDSLTALHVIEDPELVARLSGEAASLREGSATTNFRRCLELEAREYDEDESEPAAAAGRVPLESPRQRFEAALRRLRRAVG